MNTHVLNIIRIDNSGPHTQAAKQKRAMQYTPRLPELHKLNHLHTGQNSAPITWTVQEETPRREWVNHMRTHGLTAHPGHTRIGSIHTSAKPFFIHYEYPPHDIHPTCSHTTFIPAVTNAPEPYSQTRWRQQPCRQ